MPGPARSAHLEGADPCPSLDRRPFEPAYSPTGERAGISRPRTSFFSSAMTEPRSTACGRTSRGRTFGRTPRTLTGPEAAAADLAAETGQAEGQAGRTTPERAKVGLSLSALDLAAISTLTAWRPRPVPDKLATKSRRQVIKLPWEVTTYYSNFLAGHAAKRRRLASATGAPVQDDDDADDEDEDDMEANEDLLKRLRVGRVLPCMT